MAKSSLPFPIKTPRVQLRPLTSLDIGILDAAIGTRETKRNFRGIDEGELDPADRLALAVTLGDSDQCIGLVGYHHFDADDCRMEIGYALAPLYRGRGLMTEAVRAFSQYCFTHLSIHRIDALIGPQNTPSINLALRLGFRFEGGPLRDYMKTDNGFTDLMIYGLLERDLL
jgi:ribosomal-protein-alanine N-acetyltransferase